MSKAVCFQYSTKTWNGSSWPHLVLCTKCRQDDHCNLHNDPDLTYRYCDGCTASDQVCERHWKILTGQNQFWKTLCNDRGDWNGGVPFYWFARKKV